MTFDIPDTLLDNLAEWRGETDYPAESDPVIPNLWDKGEHWNTSVWRNWRRRTWQTAAPAGSRPRDLRSSYVTVELYAGTPLTTIAKNCGTSVAMIERHYAGILGNWDGERVSAEEQIRAAREKQREAVAV